MASGNPAASAAALAAASAPSCNGTAVALLRYVDRTPEQQEVAVVRLGVATEEATRVPEDVVRAAHSLWDQHKTTIRPPPPSTWESAPFSGCCEVQWDPDLGVHGCDHGGGDDLGRQSVRAIGQAIASLSDRPDHLDGSALLDALRNHTGQHDDLPLPPTVATWHMAARGGQAVATLSPLGALFWIAHLVADPGGDAVRHVVAQARVVVRERWDPRWVRNALPGVDAERTDARWLAVLVVAAAGDSANPAVAVAQNAVVWETRRALSGPAVQNGVARWRNGLEDALRTAPTAPSCLPGTPALRWSTTVMVPLLAAGTVASAQDPASWVNETRAWWWPPAGAGWLKAAAAVVQRARPGEAVRFYGRGTCGLVFAVWCWFVDRPLLAGWDHHDADVWHAACETLGPGFAALRQAPVSGSATVVLGGNDDAALRVVLCGHRADCPAPDAVAVAPGVYIAGL